MTASISAARQWLSPSPNACLAAARCSLAQKPELLDLAGAWPLTLRSPRGTPPLNSMFVGQCFQKTKKKNTRINDILGETLLALCRARLSGDSTGDSHRDSATLRSKMLSLQKTQRELQLRCWQSVSKLLRLRQGTSHTAVGRILDRRRSDTRGAVGRPGVPRHRLARRRSQVEQKFESCVGFPSQLYCSVKPVRKN